MGCEWSLAFVVIFLPFISIMLTEFEIPVLVLFVPMYMYLLAGPNAAIPYAPPRLISCLTYFFSTLILLSL